MAPEMLMPKLLAKDDRELVLLLLESSGESFTSHW
jgi:hypothetical protein